MTILPIWRDPVHHPSYIRLLYVFVRNRGHDADAMLAEAGLTWAQLMREERNISHDRLVTLFLAAARITGCDALGLELSRIVQPVAHGDVGMAVVAAADLRQSLEIAARTIGLRSAAFRYSLAIESGEAILSMRECFDLGPVRQVMIDLTALNIANAFTSAYGHGSVSMALDLPFPAPAWQDRYPDFFSGGIRFAQPSMRLRFPERSLGIRSITADPVVFAAASESCERALAMQAGTAAGNLASRVRAVLSQADEVMPTLAQMAARFAMSPSTLIRRLKQAGTSYQALLDDYRRDRAIWFLEHSDEPIAKIATRLGYIDGSNFSARFRRWFGETPSAWRRGLRQS